MRISIDDLQARIDELTRIKEQFIGQANATQGAIEDCQYWMQRIKQHGDLQCVQTNGSQALDLSAQIDPTDEEAACLSPI